MVILIFIIIHWYTSLFFQSFFHHRYSAHNICSMSRGWEKFFHIACFITQGSSYISAAAYGIMHRLHHAHTDEESDPHSPVITPNPFHMLWYTRNSYYHIYIGKTQVADKWKKNLPLWPEFDRYAHTPYARLMWVAIYIGIYALLATQWWHWLFLPVTLSMGPLQGVAVNWWAHKFGYRNFEMNNDSRNILPVDLFFVGEAFHNNHHQHPTRPNNAVKWFEIDWTYQVMRGMNKLGIIRLRNYKTAPVRTAGTEIY
jgi:stearoyl-CoA desaturase (delta-9 desaturase)